eukprot:357392-Chlamydomonas_euryale.AAC.19
MHAKPRLAWPAPLTCPAGLAVIGAALLAFLLLSAAEQHLLLWCVQKLACPAAPAQPSLDVEAVLGADVAKGSAGAPLSGPACDGASGKAWLVVSLLALGRHGGGDTLTGGSGTEPSMSG